MVTLIARLVVIVVDVVFLPLDLIVVSIVVFNVVVVVSVVVVFIVDGHTLGRISVDDMLAGKRATRATAAADAPVLTTPTAVDDVKVLRNLVQVLVKVVVLFKLLVLGQARLVLVCGQVLGQPIITVVHK